MNQILPTFCSCGARMPCTKRPRERRFKSTLKPNSCLCDPDNYISEDSDMVSEDNRKRRIDYEAYYASLPLEAAAISSMNTDGSEAVLTSLIELPKECVCSDTTLPKERNVGAADATISFKWHQICNSDENSESDCKSDEVEILGTLTPNEEDANEFEPDTQLESETQPGTQLERKPDSALKVSLVPMSRLLKAGFIGCGFVYRIKDMDYPLPPNSNVSSESQCV